MTSSPVRNPQIADEAAEWAVTLDEGELTLTQRRQLADWLLESPRHVEELLIAASLFSGLESVDPEKARSIDHLLAASAPEVVSLMRHQQTHSAASLVDDVEGRAYRWFTPRRTSVLRGLAAAAVAMIAVAVIFWPNGFSNVDSGQVTAFTTELGEQRSMTLEDGSIIHVNTQSEVAIRFADDERVVELTRGEALFEVAKDPARPFRVIAGETIAEAVGTKFNVYRASDRTTVAVIEGTVAVAAEGGFVDSTANVAIDDGGGKITPPMLANRLEGGRILIGAGQQAEVAPHEKTLRIASASVAAVESWRARQLVFESESLANIATQFNRYNRTRIIVDDERLAATEFSGVFDADDPQSLIAFLQLSGEIDIRQTRREIRLRLNDNVR